MPLDYFMHKPGARSGMITLVRCEYVNRNIGWVVKCDCGRTVWIRSTGLRTRTDCGCIAPPGVKHGATIRGWTDCPSEYKSWKAMRERCRRNVLYRDVPICAQWGSYRRFLSDMGPKPSLEHTIDRIDNSLGYSPENCRWATREEQAGNKRNTIPVFVNGTRVCISKAARLLGLCRATLVKRVRRGMSPAEAVIRSDSSLASIVSDCAESPFLPRKGHVSAPVGDPK
jgi:hypothetical protein